MNSLVQISEKKRLFVGLLGASLLTVGILTAAIWYLVVSPQQTIIYQFVMVGLVLFLLAVIIFAGFGFAGIIITIVLSKYFRLLHAPMRIALNSFFPIVLAVGRVFRIDMDRIRNSFVQVNNRLVEAMDIDVSPENLLLLAPHCLQKSTCPHKITGNINNCHRCGACRVSELLDLRDRYGIHVGIATGGTLARKYVKEYKPRAIVAIACERDLTSGILDANPIPVLGVTNLRPNGPCVNTSVNIDTVEAAIQYLTH